MFPYHANTLTFFEFFITFITERQCIEKIQIFHRADSKIEEEAWPDTSRR
jgi:hypothetical protein